MIQIVRFLKESLVLIFLLMFYSCVTYTPQQKALLKSWPMNHSGVTDYAPVYEGYIILINNDTLKGLIKLSPQYKP
jgi:hypothetical protein